MRIKGQNGPLGPGGSLPVQAGGGVGSCALPLPGHVDIWGCETQANSRNGRGGGTARGWRRCLGLMERCCVGGTLP